MGNLISIYCYTAYPLICLLVFLNSHKGGQVGVKGGLPPSSFNKEI